MMRPILFALALCACTKAAGPTESAAPPGEGPGLKLPSPTPAVTPTPPTPVNPAPAAPKVTVELTGVTLADDCGGTAPHHAPPPATIQPKTATKKMEQQKADMDVSEHKSKSKSARRADQRCEQTSMQLSVVADAASAATDVTVKQVELVDETGAAVGTLTATKPTQWSTKGMYEAWDGKVAAGQQLSVSYVLSQPNWSQVKDRWNKTYTLKVTLVVGAADQTLEKRDIHVQQATSLPPNVKT